ncbi:hypothetical protein Y1Q_0014428 [Alligator mississippiensis]|uniref:Uncharacterized protein n=1 Tax=Alligator mississippiensis TaxID=8496 RepID=A0A151PCX4_ALLMI|nr:hypothetical protein Y1Q_0014428 [Alligator mississippiensis]
MKTTVLNMAPFLPPHWSAASTWATGALEPISGRDDPKVDRSPPSYLRKIYQHNPESHLYLEVKVSDALLNGKCNRKRKRPDEIREIRMIRIFWNS